MSEHSPILEIYNESGRECPVSMEAFQNLLQTLSTEEDVSFSLVELVFVDENEIVRINKEHLDRDYVTDIISFTYSDEAQTKEIEGTLYCCAPRIIEQAAEFGADSVAQEFQRVFVHGLLHLIGYDDQTTDEKAAMTKLENKYLNLAEN